MTQADIIQLWISIIQDPLVPTTVRIQVSELLFRAYRGVPGMESDSAL